jgi:predicted Fe-Mo cluster-binding NifX family protein
MGEWVAPCFEYSATIAVFTIEDGAVTKRIDFPLCSREPFDRVRLIRDQQAGTIICGGVQEVYERSLRASGIEVISWVSGTVSDLLDLYLRGQLVPGTEREAPHETGLSSTEQR